MITLKDGARATLFHISLKLVIVAVSGHQRFKLIACKDSATCHVTSCPAGHATKPSACYCLYDQLFLFALRLMRRRPRTGAVVISNQWNLLAWVPISPRSYARHDTCSKHKCHVVVHSCAWKAVCLETHFWPTALTVEFTVRVVVCPSVRLS